MYEPDGLWCGVLIRWLPMASTVFQLIGTALIVWGLRFTSDTGVTYHPPGGRREIPHAGIVREHPWAVAVGPWLLLAGLALAVVVTVVN
jgi:hypothetical protein